MSLYPPPQTRSLSVWTQMPEEFRNKGQVPEWGEANKPGQPADSFLEGPSFDRDGNLYVTDIPYGRVFRISPDREWTLIAEYDGWPNGLKIHRDGRIFITDYKHGIMLLESGSGTVTPFLTHKRSEGFKGVNDLFFGPDGAMYFTDQGQTGMHDPTGRVYRLDLESGRLDCLIDTCPSPNGLVLDGTDDALFVAMTRGNAVWRVPVFPDVVTSKAGIFTAMAGGVSGADGMALDAEGSLYVCDAGNGCVWSFTQWAEPLHRYRTPTDGRSMTNLAFGGPGNTHIFVTESATGSILTADTGVSGKTMFSHT